MTTEEDLSGTFDMGDETADAQGAIEGGEEFKTSLKTMKRKRRRKDASGARSTPNRLLRR